MGAVAAEKDLLLGLLALQTGLIDQSRLVAAFHAWTLDKARSLAEHLVGSGDLNAVQRNLLEGLAEQHLKQHGGDVEQSLAAIPVGGTTRQTLARIGDPEVGATLDRIGWASTRHGSDDETASYALGTTTSDGQRFRILRPHARGGLGAVFVAMDLELHREVALKQILDQHADNPVSRQRFLVEAEITGGLEHPGIVPVYGLGTDDAGRPYYAMRFIRGDSLKHAIDRCHRDEALKRDPGRRSLELRRLLRRLTDVCNAIDYAHSRGVLHRDLKPGNVILGQHGETLVVDWGLAKATGKADPSSAERLLAPSSSGTASETLPGSALGTPAYMSPEQAAGNLEALGPRSDVYSLGATLYCLLTGRPPFAGDDVGAMLQAVRCGEFATPRQVDPSLDPALEAVCLKAMALGPEDRYSSCRALAEDIERWMADEPVTAWREPLSRRARRWSRRNRAAVASVLVALLGGLGAVASVQARANSLLRNANAATGAALAETRSAQAQTQAALRQSEESRTQAEAVSRFLVEAFASPNPAQDGRQVKVVDLLDRASRRLDRTFAGSPATKGSLLDTLGRTYWGLGLFDRAVTLHAQARDVLAAAMGRDHPETLKSQSNLAIAYRSAGKLSEAIPLAEETLKLREARLGPDHPDTMTSRNGLANAYWSTGRLTEAIALHEANLKLRESKLGSDDPRTLGSRNNLASAYREAGRLSEAIALDETTLKRKEAKLGYDHPDTLNSRNNLAIDYRGAGKLSEAIALDEETLKLREAKLGPDHRDTLISRDNLAIDYRSAGRLSEAIALHEATLPLLEATLGPDHPDTLVCRDYLGGTYRDAGRLTEAIALLESTVKRMEAKLGPSHFSTLASRSSLARTYVLIGRPVEAESLFRDVLARRRKTVRPESPVLAMDLAALGGCLLVQARWSEAEPLLREGLAIWEKTPRDDWRRYEVMSLLGSALLGQGRYAEAEPLVVTGYQELKAREAPIAPSPSDHLAAARDRILALYELWGKPDQAAAWKSRLGVDDLPADVFARP